jgi:hypothetical protein
MAVAKKPTQAKTSKPVVKKATVPEGGSKSGLRKALSKTKSLETVVSFKATSNSRKITAQEIIDAAKMYEKDDSYPPLYDGKGEINLGIFLENKNLYLAKYEDATLDRYCLKAIVELSELYQTEKFNLTKDYGDFVDNHSAENKLRKRLIDGEPIRRHAALIADCMMILKNILNPLRDTRNDFGWMSYSEVTRRIGWIQHEAGIDLEKIKSEGYAEAESKRKRNSARGAETTNKKSEAYQKKLKVQERYLSLSDEAKSRRGFKTRFDQDQSQEHDLYIDTVSSLRKNMEKGIFLKE